MDTIGAFQLTPGTPFTAHCNSSARWVTLRNDSPYYIGIQCGPNSPASLASPTSYPKTIAPWSGDNYDCVAYGRFDGFIYILPYVPGGVTGTGVAQRSLLSIDTYGNNEQVPLPYSGTPPSTVAQTTISVLGATSATGPASSDQIFILLDQTGANVVPSQVQLQNKKVTFFLAAYQLSGVANAGAAFALDMSIVAVTLNASAVVISKQKLWNVAIASPAVADTLVNAGLAFSAEPQTVITWGTVPAFFGAGLTINSGVGGNIDIKVSLLLSIA